MHMRLISMESKFGGSMSFETDETTHTVSVLRIAVLRNRVTDETRCVCERVRGVSACERG